VERSDGLPNRDRAARHGEHRHGDREHDDHDRAAHQSQTRRSVIRPHEGQRREARFLWSSPTAMPIRVKRTPATVVSAAN
jgi:hypothetical protein